MSGPAANTSTDNHDIIAMLAYMAWQQDGCPHGKHLDYWLEAERQFTATYGLLKDELTPGNSLPRARKTSRRQSRVAR